MENREWKWAGIFGAAAIVFLVISVMAATMLECMSGGCALMFVAGFLTISCIAICLFFVIRARTMDAIVSGTGLLVHWTYSATDAERSVQEEYLQYRKNNRALFYVIGGMLVVVSLGFALFGGDGGIVTAEVLLAFTVVLFVVSRLAPELERKRALATEREAYIARNGLVYEGSVYPFVSFLVKLDTVAYRDGTKKSRPVLVFSFIQLVGYIPRSFEVMVPVPSGEEERAREIARMLATG